MSEDSLKTLTGPASVRITDRGSRFNASAIPVMSPEVIDVRLRQLANEYLESVTITVYCRSDTAPDIQNILDHWAYLEIRYKSFPECFRATE